MSAIIIGSGIGGLALGIRLQSMGLDTMIVERLDRPGGRASVRRDAGFTFDMGPTVLTVPHFIEELFAHERGAPRLDENPLRTRAQIERISPGDVAGYDRFHAASQAIFERGFLDLGHTYFGDAGSMLRILPDLVRLGAVQPLYRFVAKYLQDEKLRATFSFEPLLVGGNPLRVPAIYAMIHFVEKTWGVHFAMGGTGALVRALVRKFEELGGRICYSSEVSGIDVARVRGKARACGVTLAGGHTLQAGVVVSNGDYAASFRLVNRKYRPLQADLRLELARPSMSALVIYFGFRAEAADAERLRHHNIIFGPRYAGLLRDIFDRKRLSDDFSQYLHVPTLTDPSLAPPGHHAAYTLVPVPHNGSGIDWSRAAEPFVERVLRFLDERGHIAGLRERLVYKSYVTPDYFERTLGARMGSAFGLEPLFSQSAYFRPHNRSTEIERLYFVGADTQPGAGTPAVMMSAKMTARLIAQDLELADVPLETPERLAEEVSIRA